MSVAALCAVVCLFAGDSLAVGMAQASRLPSAAISGIEAAHPSIQAAVRGAPGGAVVLLSVGTNDTRNITPALRALNDAARARGVRLVVLTPPCHRPASLDARSQRRAEEARAAGVETLDLRALPAGACGAPRAPDGIHFTGAGYRALAGQVLAALAP
jgi:lysophospholipase L1-like esterase